MPYFGIGYAVVWYRQCRTDICYAVAFGIGYAVILGITDAALWTAFQFFMQAQLIRPLFFWVMTLHVEGS